MYFETSKEGENNIGVNYEGGKIIEYALNSGKCLAYANVQIGMDAPYHGEIANETVRSKGRSETQFEEYSDEKLQNQLFVIFNYIIKNYKFVELIIQIARGRSAVITELKVLKPILSKLNLNTYRVYYGYKTKNYFPYPQTNFIFVNIGMFARLTNVDKIKAGDVCNPIETYDILNITSRPNQKFVVANYRTFNDKNNILNNLNFRKIILYGIADEMAFITPENYPFELFNDLIQNSKVSRL